MKNVPTGLRLALETTLQKEQYDLNAKVLLSHKSLLAWILKSCVSELRDYSVSFIENNCIEGTPVISNEAIHQNTLDADQRIEGLNTETYSNRLQCTSISNFKQRQSISIIQCLSGGFTTVPG